MITGIDIPWWAYPGAAFLLFLLLALVVLLALRLGRDALAWLDGKEWK